ncbi:MAG: hypothetical protein LBO00_01565 [Zoogloeaceae bacterium]|jgi:hypothetical protein|nr:hypothetical protein [Zoogloeaceae bacterium]
MQIHFRLPQDPRLALGILAASVLLLYGRVLGFDYVWDDSYIFHTHIQEMLQGPFSLAELGKPFLRSVLYFRPVPVLSYYLDARIAGFSPGFSHAVNLVFFLLNVMLVFGVAFALHERNGNTNPTPRALAAALLYAAHPALIESAAWISARFDLLATFFILAALQIHLARMDERHKRPLFLLLVFLALLSKESGLMFPLAFLCLFRAIPDGQGGSKGVLAALWMFALPVLAYLALRFWTLGLAAPAGEEIITYPYHRLLAILETFRFYLNQALFPFFSVTPLHPFSEAAPMLAGSLASLAFVLFAAFLAFWRRSPAACLFLAGCVFLIPVLHIVPIRIDRNIGHERFLTTPLAFWVMAASFVACGRMQFQNALVRRLFAAALLRKLALALACFWLVFAFLITFHTVPVWKDDLNLWTWNHAFHPQHKLSRHYYLHAILTNDRLDLFEEEVRKAGPVDSWQRLLDLDVQTIQGELLVGARDPRALAYLETLSEAIDAYFRDKSPAEIETREQIFGEFSSKTAASVWSAHSEAIFLFQKDAQRALERNARAEEFAIRYQDKEAMPWIRLRKIAYLYALGKTKEAEEEIERERARGGRISQEAIDVLLRER